MKTIFSRIKGKIKGVIYGNRSKDPMLSSDWDTRRAAKRAVEQFLSSTSAEVKQASKNSSVVRQAIEGFAADVLRQRHPELVKISGVDTSTMGPAEAAVEIFGILGPGQKTFVDIGCGRSGGNSSLLAKVFGWDGLMIDASEKAIARIGNRFPGVRAECHFVTPENVNETVEAAGLSECDFFSLDIDSIDYWVLEAVRFKPRVIAIEYNAMFGVASLTVPRISDKIGSVKFYSGASLAAMTKLAAKKGYALVGTDQNGTNAFFVRNDLMRPGLSTRTAKEAWRGYLSRETGEIGTKASVKQLLGELQEKGLELVAI
jgi:hypothetical protein